MRITLSILGALLLAACGHRYAENIRPVPGVEPYGGQEMKQKTDGALGLVYANTTGDNCDEAIAKAFTSLLQQAKALGGTRVINAETKNSFNWSGHLACSHGGHNAMTRGLVMP